MEEYMDMENDRIVVMGASAGGINAIQKIAEGLPKDFGSPVLVVNHLSPDSKNFLPTLLNNIGPVPAVLAENGQSLERNRIYVCPADFQLSLENNQISITRGPRENGHRPAIDPLFRSAALTYGRQVIGVILTGLLDDGTSGLVAVKKYGGTTIIQDPKDAEFSEMPHNASNYVDPDYCVPLDEIGPLLGRLVHEANEKKAHKKKLPSHAFHVSELKAEDYTRPYLSCPECGGVLSEKPDGKMIHYACYMGHILSPESLLLEQKSSLERALWSAFRALEDRLNLLKRLVTFAKDYDQPRMDKFMEKVSETGKQVDILRDLLQGKI